VKFIETEYRILHDKRKTIELGYIQYIWCVETLEQARRIQDMCYYPVTVIEKEKFYVIGYKQNSTGMYINMHIASKVGDVVLDSNFAGDKFKHFLNILGFHLTCSYKKIEYFINPK
jgi:hypothetical protein